MSAFDRRAGACIRRAMLGASILALAAAASGAASVAAAAEPGGDGEVVITGSRIVRNGFTAPTPVTVLGADRLEQRAATNVGDVVNEIPAFLASQTPAAQGLNANGPYVGGRMLNLRGLDPKRTLVLVDGKRFVPATTFGTVDTNLIPASLIERVDVVTGGASAAYGSDAVAGVVNMILDHRFNGIKAAIEGGASTRGDAQFQSYSLAWGGSFAGDRGHVVLSGEYEQSDGVGKCMVRDWCAAEVLNFGRSGSALVNVPNTPANNILPNIHTSTISQRGVINAITLANGTTINAITTAGINTTSPLLGTSFTTAGAPTPFAYGTYANTLFMVGGEGHNEDGYFGVPIVAPTERWVLTALANFEVSDHIRAGLDLSYGDFKGFGNSIQYKNTATPISKANPFIPAALLATMNANSINSFSLGRTYGDIGDPFFNTHNKTFRAVASLEGELGGSWKWDAYYQFGRNDFRSDLLGGVISARAVKAINSVLNGSGQIVCAVNADATTANDDPNCAPLNPFGNQVSAAARRYVTANGFQTDVTTEHVAAANVRGEPFSLWAGPISVAVGGEFRSDKIAGDADIFSKGAPDNPDTPNAVDVLGPNGFFAGNGSKIAGKVDVVEGYFEALIPLAKDITLAKRLDVDGAVRRTHYSRSAPTAASSSVDVTTWKVGVVWEPTDFLRFRAARSEDIRAPNVSELFGPQTSGFGILNDPAQGGLQTNPVVLSGSNPNLVPEVAETWTAGMVVRPPADWGVFNRAGLSLDYYKITIDQAIGVLGAQTIANRCFQGATEFCALIVRSPAGVITQISDIQQNVNQLKTSGLDLEFSWRQPLGNAGDLDFRMLGNYVWHLITVDSAGALDRADQTGVRGGTQPGVPRYTLDWLLNWNRDRWHVNFHGKYIPEGRYNALFIGPKDPRWQAALNDPKNPLFGATSNINTVEAAFYADLTVQYDVVYAGTRKLTAFLGVNNLTDVQPPLVPGANGSGQSILFDPVGRNFRGGLRFRY
jgi:iron complex outermembrane receptor protein